VTEQILWPSRLQTVTPLRVGDVDFRPGWRQKHAPMVTVGLAERLENRFACQPLKIGGGVHEASIEEHPSEKGTG